MTSLIEKFRNVRFPNWLRQVKADSMKTGVQAANDNIVKAKPTTKIPAVSLAKNDFLSEYADVLWAQIYEEINRKETIYRLEKAFLLVTYPVRKELKRHFNKPLKLKIPVSLKRKLRKNKQDYRRIQQWLEGVEKSLNAAIFGADADER